MTRSFEELFFDSALTNESLRYFAEHYRDTVGYEKYLSGAPTFTEFMRNSRQFIRIMYAAIQNGDFQLQPARRVHAFLDKARTIHRFNWPDTFLFVHLAQILQCIYEPQLEDSVFSFRAGRSNITGLNTAKEYIQARPNTPLFVLRRDVKNFGEEMSHKWLLSDFLEFAKPDKVGEQFFRTICQFPFIDDAGKIQHAQSGLPTGLHLQLVCENIYLLPIDKACANSKESLYLRFGDDILFITRDRDCAREMAKTIDDLVTHRSLRWSEKKSLNTELCKPHLIGKETTTDFVPSTCILYLGTHLFYDGTLSLPAIKQRQISAFIQSRLKQIKNLSSPSEPPEQLLKRICQMFRQLLDIKDDFRANPILDEVPTITNDSQLRELDRWIALQVLATAYGESPKKSLFRGEKFKLLRKMGLPSLLHARRTGEI